VGPDCNAGIDLFNFDKGRPAYEDALCRDSKGDAPPGVPYVVVQLAQRMPDRNRQYHR
jgi:hypothetical protein